MVSRRIRTVDFRFVKREPHGNGGSTKNTGSANNSGWKRWRNASLALNQFICSQIAYLMISKAYIAPWLGNDKSNVSTIVSRFDSASFATANAHLHCGSVSCENFGPFYATGLLLIMLRYVRSFKGGFVIKSKLLHESISQRLYWFNVEHEHVYNSIIEF